MLKFYTNDTTILATFEDFITTVFVIIDDLYRCYAPPEVAKRRHALDTKLSDSKIITVSLCGELAGIDSENAWYSFSEHMKELCKERNSLYEKQNDLKGQKQKIEKSLER